MKKLIFLAIILRLLVGAFFFHPDIKTYNFQASFLKDGVLNIYDYLAANKNDLPLKEEFVYFPLTYLSLGSYQAFLHPLLGPDFGEWLADAGAHTTVTNPNIFIYLLALKLPYLAIDVLIAYLLFKYFDDKILGKKAFTIWLFNPFTIVLFYIFSNVDILSVFFVLLSLLFVKKKNYGMSGVFLGIAAGFKLYPLLLLPFLMLKKESNLDRLKIIAGSLITLIFIVLPFFGNEFVSSTLITGLSTRIFSPGLPIGFEETIIPGLLGITMLFVWAYFSKKRNMLHLWTAVLTLIFAFSHFHIAWIAWVAPFAVILFVKNPKLGLPMFFASILAFMIPILYQDRYMSISLFRAYSTLYDTLPTPFSFIQNVFDPYSLQSILHTGFAGISLVILYQIFRNSKA